MSNTSSRVHDVPAFVYSYFAVNRLTHARLGPYGSLEQAVVSVCNFGGCYSLAIPLAAVVSQVLPIAPGEHHALRGLTTPVWCLCTHLGEVVPHTAMLPFLPAATKRSPWRCSFSRSLSPTQTRLKGKKHNTNKIKTSHKLVRNNTYRCGYRSPMRTLRKMKTHAERKWNVGHETDHGEYNLVRRRRFGLRSSYDDVLVGALDAQKSWKHHSKRRKQWKPK